MHQNYLEVKSTIIERKFKIKKVFCYRPYLPKISDFF